ncbi:MAG: NAD-dependent epimerase/dehydratase family protein [Bacteroidales bacterium]
MQTILGSNGVIANEISRLLPQYTDKVRQVSRHPEKVNDEDDLMIADLTDYSQTEKAVQGSEIVYLTVGLDYNYQTWQEKWPKIMTNVIDACKKHQARLVFFDNVYMYGKVNGWMTEDTAYNPCSRKGEIRARIAAQLMEEVKKGNLTALIARSADFYGKSPLSLVGATVFDRFAKQQKAQIMLSDSFKHSFTYIPDAGKATALLGNTDNAYNQVWHLPTDNNVLSIKEFVHMAADAFDCKPEYMVFKKWMLSMVALFNPVIKESMEMLYQLDSDYLFDSSKFDTNFKEFIKTDYKKGIFETALRYNL